MLDAIIFDLDGLLVDSEPLQIHAWRTYLSGLGYELDQATLGEMYGLRLADSCEVVVARLGLPVTPAEVARDRDALFLELVPGNIAARPGARECLAEARERGLQTALATSGHRRYVDLALESAGIPRDFDTEVTGEMVSRGKPDPETFLTAADRLGVDPIRCLVLEDSPNGVKAAKRAGMTCIAIPNDDTTNLDLTLADAVLPSLLEVFRWVDSHPGQGVAPTT